MDWSKETVIVFGGGGFLGRKIVHQLQGMNCGKIKIFNRSPFPEIARTGVEALRGDIRNRRAVSEACEGCTAIIHTAAKAGVWGPWREYYGINVTGTENILAACREHSIRSLVYTSSPSVAYPPTKNIENITENEPYPDFYLANYAATKAIAEKKSLGEPNKNLSVVALRPHLIWGPGDPHLLPRIVKRAAAGKLTIIGDGHNRVDMTYVDNAAWAHVKALMYLHERTVATRKVYFVSDDAPVEIWQWLNSLLTRLSIPPVQRSIGYDKAYSLASILEMIFKVIPFGEPPLTRFVVGQLAFSHYFDISAIKKDLGYSPIVNSNEAFSRTVDWLKKSVFR